MTSSAQYTASAHQHGLVFPGSPLLLREVPGDKNNFETSFEFNLEDRKIQLCTIHMHINEKGSHPDRQAYTRRSLRHPRATDTRRL